MPKTTQGQVPQFYSLSSPKIITGTHHQGDGQTNRREQEWGAHPSEGDNIEGVLPPVNCIQKLRL